MSNKILEYKGFQGSINVDFDSGTLHGKILHINDLVTYEASEIKELPSAFHEAVDDYIETCQILNVEPERPFSGSFNIRIGEYLHKEIAKFAARHNCSINEAIKEAISCHVNGIHNEVHHHHYQQPTYEASEFITAGRGAKRPALKVVA